MGEENILCSNISPPNVLYKTVGELVWDKLLKLDDNQICLIDPLTDKRLTVLELKTQANSIAVALIERGISKTDRIAFYGQNSIQHSVLRLVAYFLGITFLPLSPTFEKYEVEQEVTAVGVNVIFSSAKDLHKFDNVLNNKSNDIKLIVVFDGKHDKYLTFEQLLEEGRDETLDRIPYFDVNPETDMFLLIHTSGTTGHPKCAMMTHRAMLHLLSETDYFMDVNEQSGLIYAQIYPYGHIGGSVSMPIQLSKGATLIMFGEFDEKILYEYIEKYKITNLPVYPHIGRRMIESELVDNYDLSSLKQIVAGGSVFPGHIETALVNKFKLRLIEGYGMTEYVFITRGAPVGEEFIPNNAGQVSPGTELKIIDLNTGKNLGSNIDGEICIRGNKMFAGYLNNEKAYKESFDKNGWFRTGDIGHYDECERIFAIDRLKEVIRIGVDNHLVNISPVEIENLLFTHKSVLEVVVVGVKNTTGNHWPRAYIVLKEGHNVTEEEIEKFVSDTLAYTKQLKGGVVFVDQIQRTAMKKVDRKYYRNLVLNELIN